MNRRCEILRRLNAHRVGIAVFSIVIYSSGCEEPIEPNTNEEPAAGINGTTAGNDTTTTPEAGVSQAGTAIEDARLFESLCTPCGAPEGGQSQSDPACGMDLVCVTLAGQSFCSIECDRERLCPEQYICDSMLEACVPATGICDDSLCLDEDQDGYGRGTGCLGLDCNDNDPNVHSGIRMDQCDNVDNDCDGQLDEDYIPVTCGVGACSAQSLCVEGIEQCNEGSPMEQDRQCDGIDEDCDGRVDEEYDPSTCGQGVCARSALCEAGVEICTPMMVADNEFDESCDGMDNDCDGFLDEGFIGEICGGQGACTAYFSCQAGAPVCVEPEVQGEDVRCDGIDDDCDGRVDEHFVSLLSCGVGACRADGTCRGAREVCEALPRLSSTDETCDGVDDDCDNIIDENCNQNQNQIILERISESETTLLVGVQYSRIGPNADQTPLKATSIDLWLDVSDNLSLSNSPVTLGEALNGLSGYTPSVGTRNNPNIDADLRVTLLQPLGQGTPYLPTGEILRINLIKQTPSGTFSMDFLNAEPFVDANDNDRFDGTEEYTDANSNGRYDANTIISPKSAMQVLRLTGLNIEGGP